MSLSPVNFVMPICLLVVVLFGVLALFQYFNGKKNGLVKQSTEFFLTARNSQPWHRVAFGFFSCSVGAGAMGSITSFVTDPIYGGGYIGLVNYCLFAGIPLVIVAALGTHIRKRFPESLSIGSYSRWRFGRGFQAWVTLNVLFNLGISLTVEFTAIGALYKTFIGVSPWIPIVFVALVTMIYTSVGGLFIGLITDLFQGVFIIILVAIMGIFVAFNFRVSLPDGPLPPELDVNYVGFASFATIGIALISATMFSDAVWQRVWSAENDRALLIGATAGASLVSVIYFCFGFGGFIAAWAGISQFPNTAFLELLKVGGEIPIGMLLVVLLIASVMNESAIDSFELAIGDTLVSFFETFHIVLPFWSVRVILAVLIIPFAIIGTQGYPIISLYLITNLLTTCLMFPLLMGMVPALDRVVSGNAALSGGLLSVVSVCCYGIQQQVKSNGIEFQGWEDIKMGIYNTFYVVYDWPPFIVAIASSLIFTFLVAGLESLYYQITKKPRPVPEHLNHSPYEQEKKREMLTSGEVSNQANLQNP